MAVQLVLFDDPAARPAGACPKCNGTGRYARGRCYGCKGKGFQTIADEKRNRWYWDHVVIDASGSVAGFDPRND